MTSDAEAARLRDAELDRESERRLQQEASAHAEINRARVEEQRRLAAEHRTKAERHV